MRWKEEMKINVPPLKVYQLTLVIDKTASVASMLDLYQGKSVQSPRRSNNPLLQLCTARTAWSESDQAVRAVHSCNSW